MQDDLPDLIARVEAGTAEQQRELLLQAFEVCFPRPQDVRKWLNKRNRFTDMLDTAAFVDAALMMMPEGVLWTMNSWEGPSRFSAGLWAGSRFIVYADKEKAASTPALALTAAILRARRDA